MKRIIYGSLSVLTAMSTVFLAAKAEVFEEKSPSSVTSEEVAIAEPSSDFTRLPDSLNMDERTIASPYSAEPVTDQPARVQMAQAAPVFPDENEGTSTAPSPVPSGTTVRPIESDSTVEEPAAGAAAEVTPAYPLTDETVPPASGFSDEVAPPAEGAPLAPVPDGVPPAQTVPVEPLPPVEEDVTPVEPLPTVDQNVAPDDSPASDPSSLNEPPAGEDRLVGEGFTPFQLSYLAIAGGLKAEGIPGGSLLIKAYDAGDISAADVVAAAAASKRLGTAASDLEDYTQGVDRFLLRLQKDARSSSR